MTLRHIVVWKLAAKDDTTRAEHTRTLVGGLRALADVIPEIESLSAGANVRSPGGGWDGALVTDFADAAALEAYVAHPAHQEQAAYIRSITSDRAIVDFEV